MTFHPQVSFFSLTIKVFLTGREWLRSVRQMSAVQRVNAPALRVTHHTACTGKESPPAAGRARWVLPLGKGTLLWPEVHERPGLGQSSWLSLPGARGLPWQERCKSQLELCAIQGSPCLQIPKSSKLVEACIPSEQAQLNRSAPGGSRRHRMSCKRPPLAAVSGILNFPLLAADPAKLSFETQV